MLEKKIISVSGDPGGARALVPVLKLITEQNQSSLINFAYNEAVEILRLEGLNPIELTPNTSSTFIRQVFQTNNIGLLLSSTSHNIFNWEKHFIEIARDVKIFSLAVLDFWSNYAVRFSDKNRSLFYLPDKIAVMDERAKREMISENIPASKIVITGQPAFDSLSVSKAQFSENKRMTILRKLNVQSDMQLITFVSQPFSKIYPEGTNNPLGFDEKIVLNKIVHELEQFENHERIVLLIRPHPRESIEDYQRYSSSKIKVIVSSEGDSRDHLMASDLILGMNSILLMEACYLGSIVVSLQPGLKIADSLPTNAWGMSMSVYRLEEIADTIRSALFDSDLRKSILLKNSKHVLPEGAAQKILEYINLQLEC